MAESITEEAPGPSPETAMALLDAIRELRKRSGVRQIILAGRDGSLLASTLAGASDSRAFSHMAASLAGIADMAGQHLALQHFQHTTIEFGSGRILVLGCGADAVLMLVLTQETNIGLALVTAKQSAEDLRRLLARDGVAEGPEQRE